MADVQVNSDPNIEAGKQEQEREKQTNITYTQSEHDKAVKEQLAKVTEKYADYETLKAEREQLAKEKEERELAEKSDLEKVTAQLEKVMAERDSILGEKTQLEKIKLKSEVLSDAKYREMPKVYRDAVMADSDIEKVRESAEAVFEQFNEDFKTKKESFGIPNEIKKPQVGVSVSPNSIKGALAEKLAKLNRS